MLTSSQYLPSNLGIYSCAITLKSHKNLPALKGMKAIDSGINQNDEGEREH